MVNLIIKDILIQKKTIIYALLYAAFVFVCFSTIFPNGFGLYVMSPMVITYLYITLAVQYDDKNNSEVILNSLPLKRSDIVISKYMSIFVFGIIGIICSTLVGAIGNATGRLKFIGSISLLDIVLVIMSICIFSSIYYPVYFKFGVAKIKIFTMVIFMIFFFVPMNAMSYVIKNPNNFFVQKFNYFINNTSTLTQNFIALTIGLIIFMISLMISIHIYNNKEF
ncbi:ABC-2 transporter permease [Clostridium estertheticum]|uniref:ABC-2 transporter permease n=1 Tax=Clostridium estertheticum TaxID=238834 RepID=A0AA47EGY5_9CLOT|nr:ABC-2 transporter permease [Clostridium estertheticum]MBU3155589.1 ABC-2 transporter permease [Clostridium estertheticum]MBU3198112.1 ABC-2 transporter permease [Clostridium estertheticum]WAG60016.1 ABC-2 transporter permease [Clostridium estertheticum]WAG65904.1 ABC-2 transporter permease [Clostridium estertheticum]